MEKFFLKELYVQQTGHRGALARVGSGRLSGISFVRLGLCGLLWCKESVHLPVVDAQESAIRMAGYEAIWRADMSGVNIAYTQLLYQSQHAQHNNHPTGGPNKDVLY